MESLMSLTALFITLGLFLQDGDAADPLTRAIDLFRSADPQVQASLLDDIRHRLEESDDPGIQHLVGLAARARKELKVNPWAGRSYFDPETYAPMWHREFVAANSDEAGYQYEMMRPWENEPGCYSVRIRYDYGTDSAWDLGIEPGHEAALTDYLWGFPSDPDLILAWLEMSFDFDRKQNKIATYFNHAYCDRNGACFPNITLYDAWASQSGIEMPDVDVIAYANDILRDRTYVSPIPANNRRQKLYDNMRTGFSEYFRHRSWVEAAANIYLNPEAVIRPDHEGIRERLYIVFARMDDDVKRIRGQFIKTGTRDRFIATSDRMTEDNQKMIDSGYEWREMRNQTRWLVAETAYAVLREYGYLYE